jgi:hypothetical protein
LPPTSTDRSSISLTNLSDSQKELIYIPGSGDRFDENKQLCGCFSGFSDPICLFPVFNPEKECPIAGLGIGKDYGIAIETNGDRRDTYDRFFKEFESGLDIDIFLAVGPDIVPALLETGTLQNDLVP